MKMHEEYIHQAQRPMTFGRLPVDPAPAPVPIVPMDRWQPVGDDKTTLTKTYRFARVADRTSFVIALLAWEEETSHFATTSIDGHNVKVNVGTRNIGKVTELDREYAAYLDDVFKDLMS